MGNPHRRFASANFFAASHIRRSTLALFVCLISFITVPAFATEGAREDANAQLALLQTQGQGSGATGTEASGGSPAASPSPNTSTAEAQPTPGQKSVRERVREMPMTADRLVGLLGVVVLLGMCYLASNNRAAIEWRLVIVGLLMQIIIAVLILKTDTGYAIFDWLGNRVNDLLTFSNEGAKFVFGRLVDPTYLEAVTPAGASAQSLKDRFGFIFAFTITATIIFVASLFSILYHIGIMQRVVYGLAWFMQRTMKSISGAEALTVAAEVFMGQTEAPLTILPYIPRLTRSELLAMMIGGMGTVSGGILAVYVSFGIDPVFLLTTSVMSAPACLLIAKMLYPETEVPETAGQVNLQSERIDANLIDATARGASEGLRLALNVMAVLIAFIALVAMVNAVLGWAGGWLGINAALGAPFSLQIVFGYLFAPLAFVMGVPLADAVRVGDLLGTKLVLNEVVAYVKLAGIQGELNPRSVLIATFALCGFANIASVGIIIGGIGGLAPERRSDLARLGWRALFGGFLATCLTATLAGLLS